MGDLEAHLKETIAFQKQIANQLVTEHIYLTADVMEMVFVEMLQFLTVNMDR